MTEKETLVMKAKTMLSNDIWKDMKDNLTDKQIILYINGMTEADTLGLISGRDWIKTAVATQDDLQVLVDLEYIYEIRQKRTYAYIIADWWKHNALPAKRLRKTTLEEVLDMLYIDQRVYNLTGDGVKATEWLAGAVDEDEQDTKPTTTAKPAKVLKPSEPKPNPILEEVMAIWNRSYPEKEVKHKPGTKIYDKLLSEIIYAGVDEAKAAAARSGCEMACVNWFNFDSIFTDPDRIMKLKNGHYDKLFGDEKQIQEQKMRKQQNSTKPMSDDDKLAALGL